MAFTPAAGNASTIVTGGTAVLAALANVNGGYITNPASDADQGISPAEYLYIDPVNPAPGLVGNGTTIALAPGQSFSLIPGTTLPTAANAVTSGHKFTVVVY